MRYGKFLGVILVSGLLSVGLTACRTLSDAESWHLEAQPVSYDIEIDPASETGEVPEAEDFWRNPGPYLLDTGDRVRVQVYEQTELSRVYSVDGGGKIAMPLIGAIRARGLTTETLARRIAAALGRKYLKDPKVTVEVQTYRPFYILGEVRNAGKYPYVNGMTVETAVAIAGGYTERANERRIRITRRKGDTVYRAYVSPDFPVRPGDTLKVVERFF